MKDMRRSQIADELIQTIISVWIQHFLQNFISSQKTKAMAETYWNKKKNNRPNGSVREGAGRPVNDLPIEVSGRVPIHVYGNDDSVVSFTLQKTAPSQLRTRLSR